MHCDSELDWICKIPRGKTAVDFKQYPVLDQYILSKHILVGRHNFFPVFLGSVEKVPEITEGLSYFHSFLFITFVFILKPSFYMSAFVDVF